MAKKVNLDVAQTLITCRRGDTFQLNMTLKELKASPTFCCRRPKQRIQVRYAGQKPASDDGAVGLVASTIEGLPEGSPSYIPISDITGTNAGVISVVIHADDMKAFLLAGMYTTFSTESRGGS